MEAEQEPLDALRTMMLENRALQISQLSVADASPLDRLISGDVLKLPC